MKRKMIEIGDKPMELDPMCEIEVNEENPLTINEPMRTVIAGRLGPNEGRTGYFHVCKDGEVRESRKDLEVFNYEGTFNPISLPR